MITFLSAPEAFLAFTIFSPKIIISSLFFDFTHAKKFDESDTFRRPVRRYKN